MCSYLNGTRYSVNKNSRTLNHPRQLSIIISNYGKLFFSFRFLGGEQAAKKLKSTTVQCSKKLLLIWKITIT